jgi:hypothetical protein
MSDMTGYDQRREKERARAAELLAIAKIARGWFENAVFGAKHRQTSEPRFGIPSDDGLIIFAQAIIILRERRRQEREAADPRFAEMAAHLKAVTEGFKQMAAEESRNSGVKTNGKRYIIEMHIEDLEAALAFCCPYRSVNPVHVLASAAQRAWEAGFRWDPRSGQFKSARVPLGKNADGPLCQVIAAALAFIGERQKSPNTVEAVLKGRRR